MSLSSTSRIGPVNRLGIYLRSDRRCAWCRRRLNQQSLQIDHVVPRCEGGGSVLSNLVAACGDCNLARTEGARAFALHLAERRIDINAARRRVRGQLRRSIDRERAERLARRWYPWLEAWRAQARERARRSNDRRRAANQAARAAGLGGGAFPFGAQEAAA